MSTQHMPRPEVAVYVAGFMFDHGHSHVALIRKTHPEWQRGKLNGIGGKIRPGESPWKAMSREFCEEAGVQVGDWRHRVTLRGERFIVEFYVSFTTLEVLGGLKGQEDETIETWPANMLPDDVIPNLRWLIPLCLDGDLAPVTVWEKPR